LASTAAASSSVVIAPGAPCTGTVAYCAASNIILRCTNGYLQAGNCNDNLDEPPLGALCVDSAPPPGGSATCVAITSSTSKSASVTPTSSSTSPSTSPTITPGAPCTGSVAYCVGGSGGSDIILRCMYGALQPGNCADNLDEPPLGAVCVDPAPPPGGSATCSAITSSTSSSSSASRTQGHSSSLASSTGSSSSASLTHSHRSSSTSPTLSTSTTPNATFTSATPVVFTGVAAAIGNNWHFEALAGIGALLAAAL
jgi:hypothetical protein